MLFRAPRRLEVAILSCLLQQTRFGVANSRERSSCRVDDRRKGTRCAWHAGSPPQPTALCTGTAALLIGPQQEWKAMPKARLLFHHIDHLNHSSSLATQSKTKQSKARQSTLKPSDFTFQRALLPSPPVNVPIHLRPEQHHISRSALNRFHSVSIPLVFQHG